MAFLSGIYRSFAVIGLSAFVVINVQAVQKKERDLKQSYIDSLIQTAFYGFSSTIGMEGFGLHRRQTIDYANWVVTTLRERAKGEPNESYVNWKTSELQEQILLENEDLILIKNQELQKNKNTVIDSFNTEVMKKKPDFASLKKILQRMKTIDRNKGASMEKIIAKRSGLYSKVMPVRIGRAMAHNAPDQARVDLDWCLTNESFLSISHQTLQDLQANLANMQKTVQEQKAIPDDLTKCDGFIAAVSLGRFWPLYNDIGARLESVKNAFPPLLWSRCRLRQTRLSAKAQRLEDSLVRRNLEIIAQEGVDKALDFRDYCRKVHGVSAEKLVAVADAVMAAQETLPGKTESAVSETIKRLTDTTGQKTVDFSQLELQARRRAAHRADSIRILEESALRIAQLQEIKSAGFLFFPKSKNEIEKEIKLNEEKASQKIELIYNIIEQGDDKRACQIFQRFRRKLKLFTYKEVFSTLEATINQISGINPVIAQ